MQVKIFYLNLTEPPLKGTLEATHNQCLRVALRVKSANAMP